MCFGGLPISALVFFFFFFLEQGAREASCIPLSCDLVDMCAMMCPLCLPGGMYWMYLPMGVPREHSALERGGT